MIHLIGKSRSAKLEKFLPTQSVIGFPISAMSFNEQVNTIIQWAEVRMSRMVCVANVHMLMEGHWNAKFAQVLLKADLLTPDGMPLVWIARLMKGQSQDRVAGMELMQALARQAQAKKVSLFLLGAKPEMLLQIRQRLAQEFPGLQVTGMLSPPFRPLSEEEEAAIANEINASGAGLVFVSLGCPKQECWMGKHRGQVKAVMVGLGGAFSVYAGEKQWAPELIRRYGLEWCYRLMQEPRRLWKRYASTIPPFVWLAFKQVVKVSLGLDPRNSDFQDTAIQDSIERR
jgi:N-acetylglucosaminyldiphosphoundecaprenol N-acetyl-beta-D-mannosaminyltransferase